MADLICNRYGTEGKCTGDKYCRCDHFNNGNCLSSYQLELYLRLQIKHLESFIGSLVTDMDPVSSNYRLIQINDEAKVILDELKEGIKPCH